MSDVSVLLSEKAQPRKKASIFCLLAFVFCFLTSACGFTPIYGAHNDSGTPVAAALGNVAIANIPDRQGQELRNHLIDLMYVSGRPEHPAARLEVKLRSTKADVGVLISGVAARSEMNMWADFTLKDNDGKELLKGTAHSVVGYSKLDAQYGTLTAEQNALNRTINEVGEQIVNRLGLYYAEKQEKEKQEKP
jgi:LPS-assembly lipoprotein